MGKLTIPLLTLSIIGLVFTVKLVQALNNGDEDGLKSTIQRLRVTYPASGMYHGVKVEVAWLIFAAVCEGIAIGDTLRVVLIMYGCVRPRLATRAEEEENFKWKKPLLQYTIQVERLIVLGSIWNKCSFYGLFCWGSGPVLRWQDVLPHLLEMVFFWRGSGGVVTALGLSRSGAPNTCAFQKESEMVRGTLLLSFVTYFVLVPLSYVGCLWNYEITLPWWGKALWALLSAWGFVWAFLVNALANIKFMLSLAALLSLQAFYIGTGHGTAQLVVGIISCLVAAQTVHSLWVIMQYTLRNSMFMSGLIELPPPPLTEDNGYNVLETASSLVAGVLSITLYCLCAKPLQGSPLFKVELAFGILWVVFAFVNCIPHLMLSVPTACTIGLYRGLLLGAALEEVRQIEGGKGSADVEMQVMEPPIPMRAATVTA